jgi:hypothetical protein
MSKTKQPAIAWYFRHYSTCAIVEDSVEDALDYLYYGEEAGDLSSIGVETSDGMIADWRKHPHIIERERREEESWKKWQEAPKPSTTLHIQSLPFGERGGDWVHVASGDGNEIHERAKKMISLLGADRVRVTVNAEVPA